MTIYHVRKPQCKLLYCLMAVLLLIYLWVYFRKTSLGMREMMGGSGDGLTYMGRQFFVGGKPIRILSGAMHYFRVPREYWRDRMLKMKACGLNTLETYVAWNAHEPVPGQFKYHGMLNIREYIELAGQLGLYVILRPGPFICSEWDFGGMPSWLLADDKMKVRTNYPPYQEAAKRFLGNILSIVQDLQFTNGGPIIAVQVENEFGSYSSEVEHLMFIKGVLESNGITELLVTSDNAGGMITAPFDKEALPTANFKNIQEGREIFKVIKKLNDNFPLMVMEFWSGWFDHWGSDHNTDNVQAFADRLEGILDAGASVNFYMFHGGTNFGFMAGANEFDRYKPDVTSYDYDAPLSEAGDITEKYMRARELILEKVYKPMGVTKLPDIPPNTPKKAYDRVKLEKYMTWGRMTELITKKSTSHTLQPMEMYKFAHGVGQAYGYIVYRNTVSLDSTRDKLLQLPPKVHDRMQVLVNGKSQATFDSNYKELEVALTDTKSGSQLDLVVENLGRVNFISKDSPNRNILNKQRKGLQGEVKLDGRSITEWTALALDFDGDYLSRVESDTHWQVFEAQENGPGLYSATLHIEEDVQDTFLSLEGWIKGVVVVNSFILGRYWNIGPQTRLYLPAPFLRRGNNKILVFEEHTAGEFITFHTEPHLG